MVDTSDRNISATLPDTSKRMHATVRFVVLRTVPSTFIIHHDHKDHLRCQKRMGHES